jgi:hypothetical protein
MQVNVEADKVDSARLQIFGGGKAGEGHQTSRRFGAGDVGQFVDEGFDLPAGPQKRATSGGISLTTLRAKTAG